MAITLEQAKALQRGDVLYHVTHRNADGTAQRWRVTGKVLTWKRDAERIVVPVKYGLYTYDSITKDELHFVCLTDPTEDTQ